MFNTTDQYSSSEKTYPVEEANVIENLRAGRSRTRGVETYAPLLASQRVLTLFGVVGPRVGFSSAFLSDSSIPRARSG